MYRDVPLGELMDRMVQTTPPQKDLLLFAVEARRDDIAKYFLTLGMEWDVTVFAPTKILRASDMPTPPVFFLLTSVIC